MTSAKHQRGGSRCIRNQLVNSQALGERVVQLLAAEIRHGGVLMPWKSVKLHIRVFFFSPQKAAVLANHWVVLSRVSFHLI